MIQDIEILFSEQLNVTVVPSAQPMNAVALGTGIMLDWITSGKLERTQPNQTQKKQRFFQRLWRRIWG